MIYLDKVSQEAAWEAVARVAGIDYPVAEGAASESVTPSIG